MENLQTKLSKILQDYSPYQIYNADETGISYRLLPNRTLEFKNVSCHGGKLSFFKGWLTTMVCANVSGSDKLSFGDWKI